MKRFSTKNFSWTKTGGIIVGSAFVSDSPFHDLNEDEFEVISSRTGKVAKYAFLRIVRNSENEALWWEFAPTNNVAAGTEIHLFND